MTPPSTPATPDVATPAKTGALTRAATATGSGANGTRGAVSIVGVGKTFDDAPAVSDVSLEVGAGEFVSLLGPSGCGKTTLLRMIAGFERPTTGDIRLDGVSVIDVPPERRPVNTVFQSYALFPHMTVAQNVAFGLRQRKVPRADVGPAVADSLAMVRMADFAKRKPATLSGGQQQRVALARALANRPDVLLLDEPMSALDRKLREEMQVELKLLQRELGMTFVFVTHDQEEALSMSDRIVVMSRGRVAQIGDGRSIYARPTDRFVADFIGKQNFLPVTGGSGTVVQTGEGSLHVAATLPGPPDPATQPVVAVRPEQIWLSPEHAGRPAQPDDNAIDGVVGGIGFLGDVTQVVVTTAAGREILVRGATRNFPPLTEGQPVTCYFAAADTTFYPA